MFGMQADTGACVASMCLRPYVIGMSEAAKHLPPGLSSRAGRKDTSVTPRRTSGSEVGARPVVAIVALQID